MRFCLFILALFLIDLHTPLLLGGGDDLPEILSVFHGHGQTFIAFRELSGCSGEEYLVYRFREPPGSDTGSLTPLATLPEGSGRLLPKGLYEGGFQGVRHIFIRGEGGEERELKEGEGGVVLTARESGDFYYGVTVKTREGEERRFVEGVNATTMPVHEEASTPVPLLMKRLPPSGHLFILYSDYLYHNRDGRLDSFDGYYIIFNLALPIDYRGGEIPVRIQLHGRGEAGMGVRSSAPRDKRLAVILPFDFGNTWWYGYAETIGLNGPKPPGRSPEKGVVIDHTQRKLEYLLEWVTDRENNPYFRADTERIYLMGGSMGGTGALLFALRHPGYFTAVHAFKCFFSMKGCHPYEETVQSLFGLPEERFETPEGEPVYGVLDLKNYIDPERAGLFPFIDISAGRFDTQISFHTFPPFVKALDEGRVPYAAHFDLSDHSSISSSRAKNGAWSIVTLLPGFSKGGSIPAISKASCNDDAGEGFQIAGFYDELRDDGIVVKKGGRVVMNRMAGRGFQGFQNPLQGKNLAILVSPGQTSFRIAGNSEEEVLVQGGLLGVKRLSPFTRERSFLIFDGDSEGYYNSYIEWSSGENDFDPSTTRDDIRDEEGYYGINFRLNTSEGYAIFRPGDGGAECRADITVRGRRFIPVRGGRYRWKNISFSRIYTPEVIDSGEVSPARDGELTVEDFLIKKGGLGNRLVVEVEE